VIFSSNIIETPRSSRDGANKRERERKRKRKRKGNAPKVSSNKVEVNILRGENV
jgi:ribosome assembly protein YihI (activator of Der GTPase)